MYCPRCDTRLHNTQEGNTPIDFCPDCEGVWLDADELDSIVDQRLSAYDDTPPKRKRGKNDRNRARYDDRERERQEYRSRYERQSKRTRRSEDWDEMLSAVKRSRISRKMLRKIEDILD